LSSALSRAARLGVSARARIERSEMEAVSMVAERCMVDKWIGGGIANDYDVEDSDVRFE